MAIKYDALSLYNYYDGPIMFTAQHNNDNDEYAIYWLIWNMDKDRSDDVRAFDVYQLDTVPVGKFIETVYEDEVDFEKMDT